MNYRELEGMTIGDLLNAVMEEKQRRVDERTLDWLDMVFTDEIESDGSEWDDLPPSDD